MLLILPVCFFCTSLSRLVWLDSGRMSLAQQERTKWSAWKLPWTLKWTSSVQACILHILPLKTDQEMHVMSQGHELDRSLDISHLSTACTPLVSDEHFLITSIMHNTLYTSVENYTMLWYTRKMYYTINWQNNYYSYRMLHTISQQGKIATSLLLDSQRSCMEKNI